MANSYKVLAQLASTSTGLVVLFTGSTGKEYIISGMTVCNRLATSNTFRCLVAVDGAASSTAQYIYYDLPVPANETFLANIPITIDQSDVVRVKQSSTGFSFSLFGAEITP